MYGFDILITPRIPTLNCDANDSLVEDARKGKCVINHTRYAVIGAKKRGRLTRKMYEKDMKDPWKYLARRVYRGLFSSLS